jgi:hypothetical protein
MPSDITEDIDMTGTDPADMTCQERMAEVSMLLSLAMMRLWLKGQAGAHRHVSGERAFSRGSREILLGCPAETRLPVTAGKP